MSEPFWHESDDGLGWKDQIIHGTQRHLQRESFLPLSMNEAMRQDQGFSALVSGSKLPSEMSPVAW